MYYKLAVEKIFRTNTIFRRRMSIKCEFIKTELNKMFFIYKFFNIYLSRQSR